MSEQPQGEQDATQQQSTPEVNQPSTQPKAPPKTYSEEYVEKLRAEVSQSQVKLKDFEDRDKTEAQKTAERLTELERENHAYRLVEQRQQWAATITQGSNVPARALRGDTEEELREHFEELKALIPEHPNEPAPKKGAWGPFDPDEGKQPTVDAIDADAWLRNLRN